MTTEKLTLPEIQRPPNFLLFSAFAFFPLLLFVSWWANELTKIPSFTLATVWGLLVLCIAAYQSSALGGVGKIVSRTDDKFQIHIAPLLMIIFGPALFVVISILVPERLQKLTMIVTLVLIVFALLFSVAIPKNSNSNKTIAGKLSTPISLASLILFLGSSGPGGFGFLVGVLPGSLFGVNALSRITIAILVGSLLAIISLYDLFIKMRDRHRAKPKYDPISISFMERKEVELSGNGVGAALRVVVYLIARGIEIFSKAMKALGVFLCALLKNSVISLVENFIALFGRYQWKTSLLISLSILLNLIVFRHASEALALVRATLTGNEFDLLALIFSVVGIIWGWVTIACIVRLCFGAESTLYSGMTTVLVFGVGGAWIVSLVVHIVGQKIPGSAGVNVLHGNYFFFFTPIMMLLAFSFTKQGLPGLLLFLVGLIMALICGWNWRFTTGQTQKYSVPISVAPPSTPTRIAIDLQTAPARGADAVSEIVVTAQSSATWLYGIWGMNGDCSEAYGFSIKPHALSWISKDSSADERILSFTDAEIKTDKSIYTRKGNSMLWRRYDVGNYSTEFLRCK